MSSAVTVERSPSGWQKLILPRHHAALVLACAVLMCLVLSTNVYAAPAVPAQEAAEKAGGAGSALSNMGSPTFIGDGRFCLDGVAGVLAWQLLEQGRDLTVWGSICPDVAGRGRIESTTFLAPPKLSLFVTGLIGLPGLSLTLKNLETGEQLELRPESVPDVHWEHIDFPPPADWVGKPVQLIAKQDTVASGYWFGFTAPVLPYASVAPGYIQTGGPQRGFCRDGAFPRMAWPTVRRPPGMVIWGSYCESGDLNTGWMASPESIAGPYLRLYLAGYPGTDGVHLAVENLRSGQQLPLYEAVPPSETWRLDTFPLPAAWEGQPIRILAEDTATHPAGWVAFGEAPAKGTSADVSFAFRLLGLAVLLFLTTILPAVAGCFFAASRGLSDSLDLTAIALLTMGAVGYVAFWSYFLGSRAGHLCCYLILAACCAIIIRVSRRAWKEEGWRRAMRQLFLPTMMLASASVFIISVGFVYGRPAHVQDYSSRRFGPPNLSIDNFLPKTLADDVWHGHIPSPFVGDWLSSDRPPLQAGMALWNYTWTHGQRDLDYQVMSVILQLTCLVGLWGYLQASLINRRAMALIQVTAFFSGLTIFNAFFTWPKLLPAAFLFVVAGYLLTDRYHAVRSDWRIGAITGCATAFAALCHGGSAFAIIGLAATMLALRRIPGARFILAACLSAAILYAPWTLYQKYYDPPGDRLLKWHLAGTIEPEPHIKFSRLLATNYGKLSLKQIADAKVANFEHVFDSGTFWKDSAAVGRSFVSGDNQKRAAAVAMLRYGMFIFWIQSLDLLSLTPLAFIVWLALRRRKSTEIQQAWRLWLCTAITLVAWCLLMFLPGSTHAYQGCYFTELTAFAGGTLALWAISHRLAVLVVGCHIVFNLAVYVFLPAPQPVGTPTFMGPANVPLGCLAALSALAFLWLSWQTSKRAPTHGFSIDANAGQERGYVAV